jgi:hypothetical protein
MVLLLTLIKKLRIIHACNNSKARVPRVYIMNYSFVNAVEHTRDKK